MAPIPPWPRRSRYGVPGSMAGDDNFGCCGLVQGLLGLLQLLLFPRSGGFPAEMYRRAGPPRGAVIRSGPPAARELRFDRQEEYLPPAAAARSSPHLCSSSSQVGRMGSSRDAGISSDSSPVLSRELRFDRQEENFPPVDRNSTAVRGDLFLCSSSSRGARRTGPAPDVVETSSDEDDCVILDSDPHGAVAVTDGRESGGGDGGSDAELQIVGEKGQVACRDFPHSRHLCSNMPFGTTSHERHCTMCYCFVCDVQAPCGYWGKGLSVDDHCHATDKESKWKALRQVFRCSNLPASHPQNEISQSLALTASVPRPYSATRVQSGTSNGHTAQVTRLIEPTVSAPRPHSATGAVRGTSDVHTAQISHRLALTVSAPRASSATRVQSGASNGHSAQVTHLVEATVNAPRSHPEAGAGRGTSNTHTALITRPSEPTVSAARPYSAARTGRGTSNARTSQITRPVEQTVGAPRVYPAAGAGRDSSNAHSSQITYPAIANDYLPEPDAPEGATVYVGNLPYHIDNERLKLSFQHAGVVLFSKVIYDREAGKSRGYGFVTMNTVQEAEAAVRMYHGSVVYGRPLTVNIAAPRGSARVGHQSGSPLKLFVCNLPTQVDHSRLKELFSKHGKVVDARVVYERRGEDWCSRGFGFVTMATEEEAHNAVHSLHKQVVHGRPLTVNIAAPRAGAPVDTTSCQSGSPLKIFVSNLPTQVDHSRLEELFSKHGRVVDARVVYESREGASCSRGFGFVTMATKEEAHNAIRALNKQVLEGNPLGVKVARERPERGCPSPSNQIPLQNAAGRSQDTHTSVRASPNVAPTVSVPRAYPASRARSGTQSRPEHRGCFAIGLGGRELETA